MAARPYFGVDAPPVIAVFGAMTVLGAVLLVLAGTGTATGAGVPGLVFLLVGAATAGLMLHSSFRGKIRVRDRLLDRLGMRGDEHIVDLGCGSGLMLLGALVRAPRGHGTGIDLWRTVDQAGSNPRQAAANARALGVGDRVELITGDMSDLPLEDASADLVLACLSIHNIHDRAARDRTIAEAGRVLRAGGRLALIDMARTAEYAEAARRAGLTDVTLSRRSLLMYPPVRILTAAKPG